LKFEATSRGCSNNTIPIAIRIGPGICAARYYYS
jgi:hypothetical protein